MSWKETCVMDERARFVFECQSGELTMAALCRKYGISRPTGYKWLDRYAESGLDGLSDRSRAPNHQPHAVSDEIVQCIVRARAEHSTWGARKVLAWLQRTEPERRWPVASTIGDILSRHGLTVPRRRRRRSPPYGRPLDDAQAPNDVWCVDFKGWFRTGDGTRCDPLTITDNCTRYVLRCQAMGQTKFESVWPVFEACFREYGLPLVMRSDNGPPFATCGLGGLSRLAIQWIRLGIVPERIDPGQPQQNGRHERMHLTLQQETANRLARTLRGQQRVFDHFRREFNHDRPHEALGQQPPAVFYTPSPRAYPVRLPPVDYPSQMVTRKVQRRGVIYWAGHKVFLSEVLIGETIGMERIDDDQWTLYFGPVRLGVFDEKRLTVIRPPQTRRRSKPKRG